MKNITAEANLHPHCLVRCAHVDERVVLDFAIFDLVISRVVDVWGGAQMFGCHVVHICFLILWQVFRTLGFSEDIFDSFSAGMNAMIQLLNVSQ